MKTNKLWGDVLKQKIMILLLLLSVVLAGCNKSELTVVESQSETTASLEIKTIETKSDDRIYEFHDESVKEEVERYFNRKADQLTDEDFAELAQFNSFVVVEPVETLKDLPNLFPGLLYLNITCSDGMPKEDWQILKNLHSLKALTLTSKTTEYLEFAKDLPYLEISYSEDADMSGKNNLSSFSVLEKGIIDSNIEGKPTKLIRVTDENGTYEMVLTNLVYESDFSPSHERKIFVSVQNGERYVCQNILDGTSVLGGLGGYSSNRLRIVDVNFDGKDDILVNNGHFGNQGLVTYTCFLNKDGAYERNESFADISNPAVDNENKKILSTWRNWAASHSWAMYVYDGTDYVMTDCLTEEEIISYSSGNEQNEEVWQYTIEQLAGNEMVKDEVFTTQNYSDEEIDEMIFDENSFWGLTSDKWRTLYNNGTMIDFSIYGSIYIDDTILDIISR